MSLNLGTPTPETGRAMETYINTGVDLALSGAIDALVTGPYYQNRPETGRITLSWSHRVDCT